MRWIIGITMLLTLQVSWGQANREEKAKAQQAPEVNGNTNEVLYNSGTVIEAFEVDDVILDSVQFELEEKQESVSLSVLANSFETQYQSSFSSRTRAISSAAQKRLDAMVKQIKDVDANSFEYHYAEYASGHHDLSKASHLHKAWALSPGNALILDDMVAYYQITDSTAKRKDMSKRLMRSGTVPKGLLEYARNTLQSVSKNGVLVTYGFDDTYPLLMVQDVEGFRTDVKVISLDHVVNDAYRARICKQLGVAYSKSHRSKEADFLGTLSGSNLTLHVALTVPKEIFSGVSSKLYLVGTAMRYSESSLSNLAIISQNWGRFTTECLKNPTSSREKRMYSNYLPALIKLSTQSEVGNSKQREEWKSTLKALSKRLGKEEAVNRLLAN